jgi:predicted deacylase
VSPLPVRRVPLAEFDPGRRPGVIKSLAVVAGEPPLELPLVALVGDRPGPLAVAAAGVHGDEYEGPLALWQLAEALAPASLAGVLVALPVCNPWAFAAGLRATPAHIDGGNLARLFPGNPDGAPTERLAAALLAFVLRLRPALFVDLHSGGVRYRYRPMVGYRRGLGDVPRAAAAARAFGVAGLWALRDHPGTFNAETARRGVTTVGVEMTGGGGCREDDVAADRDGVLNLLRWLGMLADRPPPEIPGPFCEMTELRAAADGCAVIARSVGEPVAAGAALAHVRSPLGDVVDEVRAPHAGAVWVTRHLRGITRGETVSAVARPIEERAL